jgi:hypothetical protein
MYSLNGLFSNPCTELCERNGNETRIEKIAWKLYPLILIAPRLLHSDENEKHFKEPRIKSGSRHLWVKSLFNS